MSNFTLGSTGAPANNNAFTYDAFGGGNVFKANSSATVPAGGIYFTGIYVYCGSHSGSQYFQFALFNAGGDGGTPIAETGNSGPYGVGYGFNSGSLSYQFISGGTVVSAAAYASANIQTAGLQNGGSFWYSNSGWTNPFSGSHVTGLGDLAWYAVGFYPCSISSYPTSVVTPGASFSVTGLSFTAGINSISIAGVACPSWTVNSDTSLTVTAPSQGLQGVLTINTNAGSASSAGNMLVGQVWVPNGGSVKAPVAIWIPNGGGVQAVKGIWVSNGSGGVKRIW